MERPVPALALAVGAGTLGVPALALAAGILLLVARDLRRRRISGRPLPAVLLILVGGLLGNALADADARRIDDTAAAGAWMDGTEHPFTGVVIDAPRPTRRGWRVELRLDAPHPAAVSLLLPAPCPPYRIGDHLRGRARFEAWRPPANPGEFDLRRHRLRRGISGRGHTADPPPVIGLDQGDRGPAPQLLSRLRDRIRRGIRQAIDDPGARGLALALTLGERTELPELLRDDFVRAGMAHLLAISGLHLALGALLIAGVVRLLLLPVAPLLPHRLLVVAPVASSVPLVLLQTALAGAPPSCLRAATMILHLSLARILERRADAATAVGLAALVNLIHAPAALAGVGFQLSFGASVAILWALSRRPHRGSAVPGRILDLARVSLAAFLGTAPFVAWHFGPLPLAGPLVNLLAVPLASLALLPCALLVGASCAATGDAPRLLVWAFQAAADAESGLASIAATLGPAAQLLPMDVPSLTLGCVGVLGLLRRGLRARGWILVMVGASGLLLGALPQRPGSMEGWLLDVGEANLAVLRLPCGRVLMIDGGPPGSGRRVLVPFLRSRGIRRVDDLIISHGHEDHYAGAFEVYQELGAPRIITNGSPLIHRALDLAQLPSGPPRVLECPAEARWSLGGVELSLLSPGAAAQVSDENDRSLVVFLTGRSARLLFTGDMGPRGWVYAAPLLPIGRVSLLQVPHHGHRSPHLSPLLSSLNPLISFAFSTGTPKTGGNMGGRRIMENFSLLYHISGIHGPLMIEDSFPTILFRGGRSIGAFP